MQEIADIFKISKSIKLSVKMKKCVFYFMEKTIQAFWPTQQFTDTGIKTEARAVGFIEVVQAKRAIYNALRTSVHIKPPSKISN